MAHFGGVHMSKLYFRYGAMNSGKSTNLLQVAIIMKKEA